jgi:2-amino-4-hydroxy-6-hydroxymethyldihydropteridine diphosphokinase
MFLPRPPAEVVVALGLNLPPHHWRWRRLVAGVARLPGTRLVAVRGPIANAAQGPGVRGLFLNGVALLSTSRSPRALLNDLKRLEQRLGRQQRSHGDRPADLDILLWRDSGGRWRRYAMRNLQVPHPRMLDRPFVLGPLADLPISAWPPTLTRRLARRRGAAQRPAART